MANSQNQSLISSPIYVQTPIVKVRIGSYEFGVVTKKNSSGYLQYPNYVQSIQITKINGEVNIYQLELIYPLTDYNDPNYFEKVFSSVSKSRDIEFTYGDASASNFIYKNEKGIITKVNTSFNLDQSQISYTVHAVSRSKVGFSGGYTFNAVHDKPSNIIKKLLKQNDIYGLQDIFPGMRNLTQVLGKNVIPDSDIAVDIQAKSNISILEYLQYLVALMAPNSSSQKNTFYILSFVDDTTDELPGSYFKITEVDAAITHPEAYVLDIGYPGSNYVFNFQVDRDENYSIYYDYQSALHPQEYISRINENGDYEEVFAPAISSQNSQHRTTEDNKTWWSKVTAFPIKASVEIKGLLRPAILMQYVRVNIMIYGAKQINSGLYIVTKQVDKISGSAGYKTTLDMVRIND